MNKERAFLFHQWTLEDVKRHFDVNFNEGLSEKRARIRFAKYGPNNLSSLKEQNVLTIFFRQFYNIFIALLIAASVISYYVDGLSQSIILASIIILNISLGFFQEYKAEKALNDLKDDFKSKSKVLRDGKTKVIPNEELVLGDIVMLDVGDRVPADLRLIDSESLSLDESALTGESVAVGKFSGVLSIETVLSDRTNMLFGGTSVVKGRAKGVVVSTGFETEFGKIAGMVSRSKEEKTPLEKQVLSIGKTISLISLAIVALVFVLGYLRGFEILSLMTLTIALLVGAVPESLPTVITLSLAIGVGRMAKKKAVVRQLEAVETLGTVNIIATDKTGTLTNNELSVDRIVVQTKRVLREISLAKGPVGAEGLYLLEKGVVCSNVNLKNEDGEILGDPVEVAIAMAAKNLQSGLITRSKLYKRISEIPFDSENKYMSVTADLRRQKEVIVKGSAEKVLSFCAVSAEEKRQILEKASLLSKEGFKVIALAVKEVAGNGASTLSALNFKGLIALADEPSEGIKEAMSNVMRAGIRPVMITGDHPETARFIAEKIGLSISDEEIMTGEMLETLSSSDLKKSMEKVKIFARITPEDKINIVRLLQKMGYVVAVTGDGINDAPALKEASVGIAMGVKGTDVAKDSADIVLSDDKYKTILSAIEYGRAIFDNIKNAIVFLLAGNIHAMFLIGFAFLCDLPLPLLTVQILWINMITDSLPAMALAFEKPSPAVLSESPRPGRANSMNRSILYALCISLVLFIIGLLLYLWGLSYSVEKARSILFTFSVFSELVCCFSIRSKERIWQNWRSFFANKFLLVTIAFSGILQLLTYIKPFSKMLEVVSLSSNEILVILISIILTFFACEGIRSRMDKHTEG